ncbi:MAG TPA: hypothetical protein VF350_03785 [Candidatus Bathyarchaeia archaeon]
MVTAYFIGWCVDETERSLCERTQNLESKLKNDIVHVEESIVAEQSRLKGLRKEVGQVSTRLRRLEYKERLRKEFINMQVH